MSDSRVSKTFRVKPITESLIKQVVTENIARNQTDAVDKLMASGGFFMSLDDGVREMIYHLICVQYVNEFGRLDLQFNKELVAALNL